MFINYIGFLILWGFTIIHIIFKYPDIKWNVKQTVLFHNKEIFNTKKSFKGISQKSVKRKINKYCKYLKKKHNLLIVEYEIVDQETKI